VEPEPHLPYLLSHTLAVRHYEDAITQPCQLLYLILTTYKSSKKV